MPATAEAPRATHPIPHEHTADLPAGVRLFYRSWEPPQTVPALGAVVLVHRGHEHSGRLQELAQHLASQGHRVFAWDQRGHGRSPGERGDAPSFGTLVKDLDLWVTWICEHHALDRQELSVVAHSVGAVIAAAWVHDYAPPVRAMALVTPALRVRLYLPLAIPGLRLLQRIKPHSFIKSYVRSSLLTHDRAAAADYDCNPLISRNISVRILLGLHDTATRLIRDAAAIRTPTLLLSAGSDWVVSVPAQRAFFERLGSPRKEFVTYDGFRHAVLHESGRQRAFDRVAAFLADAAPRDVQTPAVHEHRGEPDHPGLLTRLSFSMSRLFLKTVGRLSHGIALGWRTGFDSGQSLDHVYGNRARGVTPLGRLIDRVYLGSPGWRGIRARKQNLETILDRAIRDRHDAGQPARILDIAAGPGRYVLNTIARSSLPVTAVLRDRDQGGLAAGRRIAADMGVQDKVRHEPGDAFDPASIASARPRPTIAISSGVYELFGDNTLIRRSLAGLHAALEDDGLLLYTNQPWHPQLAFIANVLINRDQQPWIMRCRSQSEIDALVREAGFEKLSMETDEHGIFTVSLARKITS